MISITVEKRGKYLSKLGRNKPGRASHDRHCTQLPALTSGWTPRASSFLCQQKKSAGNGWALSWQIWRSQGKTRRHYEQVHGLSNTGFPTKVLTVLLSIWVLAGFLKWTWAQLIYVQNSVALPASPPKHMSEKAVLSLSPAYVDLLPRHQIHELQPLWSPD